ncbi:carboxypeptidase-like regulatory domain-containing protein [Hymenobacter daeguensis]
MRHATINIPSACHESWAAMTPVATGRHCARCQETVVDFTRMTDAEVVAFLRRYPSVACGRFRPSQTGRPLPAAEPMTGWRRWLGATVALLGFSSLLAPRAQGQPAPPAYWGGPVPKNVVLPGPAAAAKAPNDSPALVPPTAPSPAAHPFVIAGIVCNAHGAPVSGIEVDLSGSEVEMSATTNEDGAFQFVIEKDILGEYASLAIMRFAPLHLYYQYAGADVDLASNQQYRLQLKTRLRRRRIHAMGKFR